MKQVLLLSFLLSAFTLAAQEPHQRIYTTSAGELIFSFATVNNNGHDNGNVVRFAPVFNGQNWLHVNANKHLGFFIGSSLRNVGFIYNVPDSPVKKKFRTYTIGLPVGFKLGNMQKTFLFAGYELELPFHYKEKTFEDEKKIDKFGVWFSNRVPAFYHSVMVGLHFKHGMAINFKYYLNGFFNQNYVGIDENGQRYKPYGGFEAHVFYFSLQFDLFKNMRFYYAPPKEAQMKQASLN